MSKSAVIDHPEHALEASDAADQQQGHVTKHGARASNQWQGEDARLAGPVIGSGTRSATSGGHVAAPFVSKRHMNDPQSFHQIIDGVQLQWSERGAGNTVVVLHGLSDSEHSWWPVMAELGKHYRVLGLDLPGCGLSGRPDASYTLDWQTRLVAAWLDHVGVTACDVVGHSYGGGLAMWLLLYRGAAVRRLALVAPGGLGPEVAVELRLASLPFFTEQLGQPWMGAVTRLLLLLNGHSLAAEARSQLLRFSRAPGTARAFARTVRDVIGWRGQTRHFFDRASDVRALPAIALFWGENDRIIPIRQGEELAASLENCSLRRFPGAGHFLHWEKPHELASALLEYLEAPDIARAKLRSPLPLASSHASSRARAEGRARRAW